MQDDTRKRTLLNVEAVSLHQTFTATLPAGRVITEALVAEHEHLRLTWTVEARHVIYFHRFNTSFHASKASYISMATKSSGGDSTMVA